MTITADQIQREIFELEGVRVSILPDQDMQYSRSYSELYYKRLPDDATLQQLDERVAHAVIGVPFGVVNPLGAGNKLSSLTVLGNIRSWWPQPKRPWWKRAAQYLLEAFETPWLVH